MRILLQLLYRLKRAGLSGLGVRTRGVKVMVFNRDGEILLIRNSYGRTNLHVLPGGGIGRREEPADAAHREVREETGVSLGGLMLLSVHFSEAEGKKDRIHLFAGFTADTPDAGSFEVEEARFFTLDALPETLSPATRRRIEEYLGKRPVSKSW